MSGSRGNNHKVGSLAKTHVTNLGDALKQTGGDRVS
jgi:hypothetical protein